MIGSLISRGLVMIFGYAYPAYECFKSVEMNKPDIEQLRFWCQYWILLALLTVCERIGDMFVGWVPMYGEAKLAFIIYLWFPKTKGTRYVYEAFFRPYISKHETDIDRNLLELRTRAGDMAVLYWQKAASYSQTRVFDILQYIASQSNPQPPRPPPQTQQGTRVFQNPIASSHDSSSATTTEPVDRQPSRESSSIEVRENKVELTKAASVPASSYAQKTVVERSKTLDFSEMQVDSDTPEDEITEEAGRITRARSRLTRGAASNR